MLDVSEFYKELIDNDIKFFTGVPDSLLKSFCAYVNDNTISKNNIIAANEGNAVGLVSGYHLATGKIGLVYMQNSGLGNTINPITSLSDKLVYSIPMLLVIGWRGEPGKKDEPQHKKQGLITTKLLETLNIKYKILSDDTSKDEMKSFLRDVNDYMKKEKEPYALVIKKGTFNEYKLKNNKLYDFEMTREEALEVILSHINEKSIIVSTTGMLSRELFELREKRKEKHDRDFLTVGSMGHASQIALGIALNKKNLNVYCLDGDGALLMHLGGITTIGHENVENFKHIVMNNGAHDSVGGQETVALDIDILALAKGARYSEAYSCSKKEDLIICLEKLKNSKGPTLLEIKVKKGARKNLGRPTQIPIENKEGFMKNLEVN
ncbi:MULTISPECIES: phosphonopyruvate decarboxylase [Clostridium]|uniref:Phosphonopyruvate decarboxylase n=1 Tax=Clostridium aquiflavi TaxID=3073603 RepID=A0ABU1EF03_9CLOT|nr:MULTISPECIES: phosphonopyruvate decarboxylase [unclassified Clostridium]MDR5586966.1 phosphonopyruvate decarboxylase [Clostridium sp. 5N-1]NFG60431.1 phosphonopyruvate decarboxylase [Clostridium botulinum]NFQ09926.1 phosphonopyruvate decarboxylase [Clostridium botulinum]